MKEDGLQIPEDITDDCVDLLLKMLKLKEEDRIQISQIREHPWLQKDFDGPPQSYLPDPEEINDVDMDIIDQLKQIGFTEASSEDSINEILSRKRTQLVATYTLLLSKKKKLNKIEKQKLRKKPKRSFTMSRNNGTDILFNLKSENKDPQENTEGSKKKKKHMMKDIEEEIPLLHLIGQNMLKKSPKKPKRQRNLKKEKIKKQEHRKVPQIQENRRLKQGNQRVLTNKQLKLLKLIALEEN